MVEEKSKSYQELRDYLDRVPVIETHEHYAGHIEEVEDILTFVVSNYFNSDLLSAAYGSEKDIEKAASNENELSFDERYSIFEKFYRKSDKTGYARGMQLGLKECWDIESITKDSLKALEEKFEERDQEFYNNLMDEYGIKAAIVNIDIEEFVRGKSEDYTEQCRFAFPLPEFHNIHSVEDIHNLGNKYFQQKVTSLDDYLEGFESYLKECIDFGIVCIKDQTAYRRTINYTYPSRAEAEKVFNYMLNHPREVVGDKEGRVLDDWLFHYFMKLARRYELPVQIHTGHMAGIRNEIEKTNAVNLTSILENYSEIKFDLFHGNWPYLGELLFLGKNYPNVWLDLCWVQSIDPLYSIELMKRALVTVPHAKIMVFGGDTFQPEWEIGYLVQARDNVAAALSEMVEKGRIDMKEARQIAADWFFNNPNQFFDLGFEEFAAE